MSSAEILHEEAQDGMEGASLFEGFEEAPGEDLDEDPSGERRCNGVEDPVARAICTNGWTSSASTSAIQHR